MSANITKALADALREALPYLTRLGYQTSVHDPVNAVQRKAVAALNWYEDPDGTRASRALYPGAYLDRPRAAALNEEGVQS